MTWHAVGKVGAVRTGDVIAIAIGSRELILGLDGERYFATQRRCVHHGGDLADGIVARGHVVCPQHGWRFSTATGCHEQASNFCLQTYPVRVNPDGVIEIETELEIEEP